MSVTKSFCAHVKKKRMRIDILNLFSVIFTEGNNICGVLLTFLYIEKMVQGSKILLFRMGLVDRVAFLATVFFPLQSLEKNNFMYLQFALTKWFLNTYRRIQQNQKSFSFHWKKKIIYHPLKPGFEKIFWETMYTRIKGRREQRLFRAYTVCVELKFSEHNIIKLKSWVQ